MIGPTLSIKSVYIIVQSESEIRSDTLDAKYENFVFEAAVGISSHARYMFGRSILALHIIGSRKSFIILS